MHIYLNRGSSTLHPLLPVHSLSFRPVAKRSNPFAKLSLTMKQTILLLLVFIFPAVASAQTPTLVQHVSCPNGRQFANQQSSAPDYKCPLPEPSQAGNTLIVGVVGADAGATFTLSDDKSNSWTLVKSVVDGNNAYVAVYVATNVAAGTRFLNLHRSTVGADAVAMSASEYYNVSGADASSCNSGSNSTTITSGSMTPSVSGDLLWQWAINAGGGGSTPNSVSSFTVGSQSNITWQFNGTDIYDGDAVQAGIYNSTSAINPTFTSGTAETFTSCAVALKAGTAGNAPSQSFRVLHMLHQQMPQSAPNPWPIQFAASGNLVVVSYISGGSLITSISSTPSNTWSSTGSAAGGASITAASQIYYSPNTSTSGKMSILFTRDNSASDATYMVYDFAGAASSPFDVDSGGQTGNEPNIVGSLTTCSGCLTPSSTNEVIIGNQGQNWCTAIGVSAPNGGLFDVATDTVNSVNGPEYVDQNNGWFHYYNSNTSAITATWAENCGSNAESAWAGRVAAFKAGSSITQQPAPPTQLTVVVN
jgi:hypothetical protein